MCLVQQPEKFRIHMRIIARAVRAAKGHSRTIAHDTVLFGQARRHVTPELAGSRAVASVLVVTLVMRTDSERRRP